MSKPHVTERQPGQTDPSSLGWADSRRSFLKLAGFSFAATLLPGCGGPDKVEAVPFLLKPEAVTPGRPTFFATLCGGCQAGCGILAKNAAGRPIKIEGNPLHPLSGGRTCAVGQAAVLGLYDSKRLAAPLAKGKASDWAHVDAGIGASLAAIKAEGGAVRLLTSTVNGPTRRASIEGFLGDFKDARHVMVDPLSASALLDAHARVFGTRRFPRIHLERARVVASFDADFLGTWISPVEHAQAYGAGRRLDAPDAPFSYHCQLESRMSLTGSNADVRVAVSPQALREALDALATAIAAGLGVKTPWTAPASGPGGAPVQAAVEDLAKRMLAAPRGRTLVLCGTNDLEMQRVAAWVNHALGNYRLAPTDDEETGTLDLVRPSRQRMGDDRALRTLVGEIQAGKVAALFVDGVNPVYDLPEGDLLAEALAKVPLVVSFAEREDETAALAHFVCPVPHALESWDDAEPVSGRVTVSQPAVRPLGRTRAFVESLAVFRGQGAPAHDLMREVWQKDVFSRGTRTTFPDFEAFWERSVHDGFVDLDRPAPEDTSVGVALRVAADAFLGLGKTGASPSSEGGGFHVVLYPKIGLLDGRHAHNPWLQEMPDPVTKIAWENCACLSPERAKKLGVVNGDVVRLGVAGEAVEAPVLIQPGQHDDVVAIARGYGRRGTERFANIGPAWIEGRPTVQPGHLVGVNVAPLRRWRDDLLREEAPGVDITPTGRTSPLALSQIYGSLDVPEHLAEPHERRRPMIHQTSWEQWREDPTSGRHAVHEFQELWADDFPYQGHHWGLAIDLAACTGCSACVVACQAENNIPVVGKDEVRRLRDMNWIRVDRYYQQGEDGDLDVRQQPMMCQQCDHAPCETVCPVLATVHGSEGLNQQVYNRCVGTRYCANNCPYKARRFNWFDYRKKDRLENMVLNPGVTVRMRGVMEKCTFCVQRISEAKAEARREGRPMADGDVTPACAQACPAGAMVFGDTNDKASRVTARLQDPRAYRVLGELNVQPSVGYLTDVKNRDVPASSKGHSNTGPGGGAGHGGNTGPGGDAGHATPAAGGPKHG